MKPDEDKYSSAAAALFFLPYFTILGPSHVFSDFQWEDCIENHNGIWHLYYLHDVDESREAALHTQQVMKTQMNSCTTTFSQKLKQKLQRIYIKKKKENPHRRSQQPIETIIWLTWLEIHSINYNKAHIILEEITRSCNRNIFVFLVAAFSVNQLLFGYSSVLMSIFFSP